MQGSSIRTESAQCNALPEPLPEWDKTATRGTHRTPRRQQCSWWSVALLMKIFTSGRTAFPKFPVEKVSDLQAPRVYFWGGLPESSRYRCRRTGRRPVLQATRRQCRRNTASGLSGRTVTIRTLAKCNVDHPELAFELVTPSERLGFRTPCGGLLANRPSWRKQLLALTRSPSTASPSCATALHPHGQTESCYLACDSLHELRAAVLSCLGNVCVAVFASSLIHLSPGSG